VLLLAGLQGAGKTTTAAKLAKWLRDERKKKVLTVSADVYRPAAIEQLKTVSAQAGAEFFPSAASDQPVEIVTRALDHARRHFFDVLIVDTAGRLAIDEAMMDEVARLHAALRPIETLFVVDAMLGQDAVNTARAFNDKLPLTGVVLTKLDGDARGGAAISVRHVTGKPSKFVGVAEKIGGLEAFDPDRMAGRILGMGDIVALVEDVRKSIDVQAAEKLAKRMQSGSRFDLNDFREQIGQMRNMGGISSLLDKLPAQFAQAAGQVNDQDADRQIRRVEGIINSMTPQERTKPDVIKASRKRRIAAGAGVPVQEVNRVLNQFEQTQSMMKMMKKGGLAKMARALGGLKGFGGMPGRRG
jgi:signal recognition particle subunit SRP54